MLKEHQSNPTLSLELLTYALAQQPSPQQPIQFTPETIAESAFQVSINPSSEFSTSTFFNKVHAVSLDRSTTDNNWVLVLELSSKTLRITE